MKALQAIATLRRRGRKPRCVMVDLVPDGLQPTTPAIGHRGIAWLDIPRSVGVADIDFRPLVGLQVHLGDSVGDATRLRAVAKAIAEVEPSLLCVFTERDGTTTMHRRFAGDPPRQESVRL